MLKAIIFDVDGVLVDSFESNFRYFKDVAIQAGYRPLTKVEYRKAFHLTVEELIKKYWTGTDKQEYRRVYQIAYELYLLPEVPKIQPGSIPLIRKLKASYKLGVVTGRIKEGMDEYFEHSKVRACFKAVVCFEHYRHPKPHPEPLLKALSKLKVKPGEAVYIGDALTDLQAAEAAGMEFILFNRKRVGSPDYRVKTFKDLGKTIDRIAKKTA